MIPDNAPLISVIMPCFNSDKFLLRSLSSVLNQSYSNIELIVVNDGSTDNSLQILTQIEDSRLVIVNQANAGVCRARNKALSLAKGDFIAFLDSDDTWTPDCLSKLALALHNHPGTVLAYCGWQNIGLEKGKGDPFIPPNYERLNKLELLLQDCLWPIHATLTRRVAIDNAGGFDESLLTSEDFLLWLKIASQQTICLVPEVLAFYHHDNELQASRNNEQVAINHFLAQQKFIKEFPNIVKSLSKKKIKEITTSRLLHRAYVCYWGRDLKAAHTLFRKVIGLYYFHLKDFKYLALALLPFNLYKLLIVTLDK